MYNEKEGDLKRLKIFREGEELPQFDLFSNTKIKSKVKQLEEERSMLVEKIYPTLKELSVLTLVHEVSEETKDLFKSLKKLEKEASSLISKIDEELATIRVAHYTEIISDSDLLYKVILEAIFEKDAEGVSHKLSIAYTDKSDPVRSTALIEYENRSKEFLVRISTVMNQKLGSAVTIPAEFLDEIRTMVLDQCEHETPELENGLLVYYETSKRLKAELERKLLLELFKQVD